MEFLRARVGGAAALKGAEILTRRLVGARYFDIVLIPVGKWLVSLLCARPHAEKPRLEASFESELTPREIEVARLKDRGFTNRETAARLFVSQATVRTHVNRIHRKRSDARSNPSPVDRSRCRVHASSS